MIAKTLVLVAGAAAVNAYTLTTQLTGNALLTPNNNGGAEPVQGATYTVTWNNTGMSPLADLALCMGPSTNCQFLTNIALQFENTGTYSWKVDCSLAPTTSNAGYGMQIIDDATGQYQYSTQFGIVADTVACSGSQPSSSGGPSSATDSTTAPSGSPTSGGGHTRTGHSGSGSGSMTTSTTSAGSAPSGTGSGPAPTGPAGGYGLNSTSTAYVVPTGPAGGSQPAATPAGSSGASSVARSVGGVAVAVLAAGVFLAWA